MITQLLLADGNFIDLFDYFMTAGVDRRGVRYLKFRFPEDKVPIEKLSVGFLKQHFSSYEVERHARSEALWNADMESRRTIVCGEIELTLFK